MTRWLYDDVCHNEEQKDMEEKGFRNEKMQDTHKICISFHFAGYNSLFHVSNKSFIIVQSTTRNNKFDGNKGIWSFTDLQNEY